MGGYSVEAEDPRYTLTAAEREEVIRLKAACDKENVPYSSIFELAKYCLVSSSILNADKRLEDSLSRLKKRKGFMAKHALEEMKLLDAVKELESEMPGWAIPCGKIAGKHCVGYTSDTANPAYMKTAFKTICKVELSRFDLAASDLEEARKGFFIVGSGRGLKGNPIHGIRVAISLRVLLDAMHANRVKGIYYELPSSLALLSSMFLKVLPNKIRERICLGKSLTGMKVAKEAGFEKVVPRKLGGTYEKSLVEWFEERIAYREKSDKLVML